MKRLTLFLFLRLHLVIVGGGFAAERKQIEGLDWPKEPFDGLAASAEQPKVLNGRDLSTDPAVFRDARRAMDLAASGNVQAAMQLRYWSIKRRPSRYGRGDLATMSAATGNVDAAIYWLQESVWAESVVVDDLDQNPAFRAVVNDPRWPKLREFLVTATAAWTKATHHQEVLVLPRKWSAEKPIPVLIFLHGLGGEPESMLPQSEESISAQALADKHKCALLSLSGPIAFGCHSFAWTNDLDRDYRHIVGSIQRLKDKFTPDTNKLLVVGFSRGAQEGVEIAARYPEHFLGAFAICPGTSAGCRLGGIVPPPDLKGRRFLIIRGKLEGQPSLQVASEDARLLEQAGGKVLLQSLDGMGHQVPENYAKLINDWLEVGLLPPAKP